MNKIKLIELYEDLLKNISVQKNNFHERDISIFNIGIGSNYHRGLLVYGRAVNGWTSYEKNDLLTGEVFEKTFDSIKNSNLNWIVNLFNNPVDNWKPKRSAFWRLSKKVATSIYNNDSFSVINNIAWSNLYKVSKANEGNPSVKLQNIQLEICKNILIEELDILQPSVALFLTSLSWAKPLLPDLMMVKLEMNYDFKFVELIAKYNETIIVVGQHPQGKPEESHKVEILNAINLAKSYFNM